MPVLWSEEASRNLEEVGDYVARFDPRAAGRLVRRITDAADALGDQPMLGRPGRVAGTRELVISGTSYILPYRIRDDRCEILAVYHAAREWPKVF